MQMFELVEVDMEAPEGDNETLMSPKPGSFRQMQAHMMEIIEEMTEDYDVDGEVYWSRLRIQPVAG